MLDEQKESLYRTRWLMAHNRLHEIAHKGDPNPDLDFDDYLAELRTAESVAAQPA